MAAIEVYQDLPQTQVGNGGTDAPAPGTQQTWTVASSGSFPAVNSGATQPAMFHVSDPAQASELITVINISGLTWTVLRGAEGTTPVAHQGGFTIKQVVTNGGLSWLGAGQNPWQAPGGIVAETTPRILASSSQQLGVSGTLYFCGVSLPQFTTISTITMATKATAAATLTHGWCALLDQNYVVRAVTADQTSGTWTAANTSYPLNVTAAYVTTYTGLYFIAVNVSATTLPALVSAPATSSALAALAPILCGSLSTGYSATPPAVTTVLSGPTANAAYTLYGGLS